MKFPINFIRVLALECKNPAIATLATNKSKPTYIWGWVSMYFFQL